MGDPVETPTSNLARSPSARTELPGLHLGTDTIGPTGTGQVLADVLTEILHVEQVPFDSHFFNDLGADSMVMAQFCARVRKRAGMPSVSMKDIYRNPTISSLAAALAAPTPAADQTLVQVPIETVDPASTLQYVVCGGLQVLFFLGYSYAAIYFAGQGIEWIAQSVDLLDVYRRSLIVGTAGLIAMSILPILLKWILIGRWKPQRQLRIWSLAYVRFWVVKTVVRSSPLALLFIGTPLYSLYLRTLGAKVGRRVLILSRNVPVCTDLLTIGADTVIRKDAFFFGYRAHAGRIETGAVTHGRNVSVGEKAVLDINTTMGDGAQLGHASSLGSGMKVPDGERWAGSAAQRADVDYVRVGPARCGTLRRLGSSLLTLVLTFFVFVPLGLSGLRLLTNGIPQLAALLSPGTHKTESGTVIVHALVTSLVLFTGATLIGLLIVGVVPRVLNCFVKPDKVYPLYGIHHWLHRTISGLTNVKFFVHLFGESSYVVPYLRLIGYNLSEVVQTGANFGLDLKHENPYLVSVGSGTMVADGLSIINAEFSSTSFRVSRVSIGPRNFLGNNIVYPSGGRTGENCLLATKVMVPLDGEIREATGLLGSPSFEIPRSVERDSRFDHLRTGRTLRRNLARKNRYDLRTIGVFLFVRWLYTFLSTMLVLVAVDLFAEVAHLVSAALLSLTLVVTASYFAVVERCFTALRPLQPKSCSMYDPYFWWHERLWKVIADTHFAAFDGTPFKNILWRLLGVRLGKRVFDDGCFFSERTLVAVGDDSTLNHGSRVQCHSQEDGTFKSDYTTIGAGCTLGVGAHVHYGVTLGDGSVLAPDSFLMKGEEIPQHGLWGGNPAREIQNDQYQPA